MHISLHGPTVKAVVLGLVLGLAITAITPSSSHAIPTAGDYIFISGPTGTFTSSGTDLTAWSITDLSGKTWSNLDNSLTLLANGPDFFEQTGAPSTLLSPPERIFISWTDMTAQISFKIDAGCCRTTAPLSFTYTSVASVPEPTSFALVGLGLGLLLLADYVRRQRRQGGLQIG
jgi:hypothetical protein